MTKQELLVDFITSLDGYGAAEGWPGLWGLEGPEYLAWLGQQPERDYTILMGANTYRVMHGFAAAAETSETEEAPTAEEAIFSELAKASKVVFSSTLQPPLSWANTRLISEDAVEAVKEMKREGRPRGPFPGGRLPRDHWEHRLRPDLRRLSRCRPRYGCQPDVRRPTSVAGVRPQGAFRSA
jgi:dihydrofolate reductase